MINYKDNSALLLMSFIIFISSTILCFAQKKDLFPLEKFENYSEFPRELIYTHLNKSTLIKGEMLGFTVYTFDKFIKVPSSATTNIYCTISDSQGKLIKKKLIKAENGIASNVFNIDSLFTNGQYTFKAYTNWMLNFDEKNYFESAITVIDSDLKKEVVKQDSFRVIDLQILPEGGHLIEDCQNTVGIIAKGKEGFGIANLKGVIVDSQSLVVSEFQLNEFGLSKTIILPKKNESYRVILDGTLNEKIEKPITNVESIGFNMTATELRDKLILSFKTNPTTLKIIKDDFFHIIIHNGSELKLSRFTFDGKSEVNKILNDSILYSGMNIITIFNSDNKPILERLYFNYNGIKKSATDAKYKSVTNDSLNIELSVKDKIDQTAHNSLSISILPKATKSHNFNDNILSTLFLVPYVKGPIENGSYYFNEITPSVKSDLDILLISQGWSSYDWQTIFNNPPLISNNFEFGISTLVNINDKTKEGLYMTLPTINNTSEIFSLTEGDTAFNQKGLFPLNDEEYSIGKSDGKRKPSLYVQFYPSKFPELESISPTVLMSKKPIKYVQEDFTNFSISWEQEAEQLDEVVINAKIKEDRMDKLQGANFGKVDLFDDRKRRSNMTFAMYISNEGYVANEVQGTVNIAQRNPTSSNTIPLIYLDDVLLADFSILYQFRMNFVDYVVIDRLGAQAGVRGSAGVIKIYTDPSLNYSSIDRTVFTSTPFPLTFSSNKKYYTPVYQSYGTDFYRNYGVIDWIPKAEISDDGRINIKVKDYYQEFINIYIEGFINNNTFISEVKTIRIN